jgi:signal transduction histidine kinase
MDGYQKKSGLGSSNDPTGEKESRAGASSAKREKELLFGRLFPLLVQRRKRVVVLLLAALILVEVAEHVIVQNWGETAHIIYDTAVFVIFTPIGLWALLSLIETVSSERDRVPLASNLRSEFSQQLGESTNWEDLVQRIVEYAHQVAPDANATLFAFDPSALRLEPEAAARRDGSIVLKPPLPVNPDTLPVGSLPQLLLQSSGGQSVPRSTLPGSTPPLPPHRYDLLISRNDQLLGVIKLEYPLGSSPGAGEVRMLKSAAPVIALALEVAMLQRMAAEQAAASAAQRQSIAQNLHDSLAQNISYLRLKLDQLTGENAIHEIGAVLQELERMRATADEAYQQVRSTLDELATMQGEDLQSMIQKQAQAISSRAGFTLHTSRIGEPYPISPAIRQQILYIVREALHNVEKHSKATEVTLQYCWLDSEIIIKIHDDGIGFNPRAVNDEGHYGLWIMQQRAQEIGGTVKVIPIVDKGTEVTLWVPRPGLAPSASNN